MARITLPSNPYEGQQVVDGNRVYVYDSTKQKWNVLKLNILGNVPGAEPVELPTISTETFATSNTDAYVAESDRFNVRTAQTFTFNYKIPYFAKVVGIETSDIGTSTVDHYRANNTIVVTVPTGDLVSNGAITLKTSNGRRTFEKTWTFSSSFAPPIPDQQLFEASSTSFTVPANVRKISIAGVGSGGRAEKLETMAWSTPYSPPRSYNNNVSTQDPMFFSGGGGALAYSNEIDVTPGETLTVVAGSGNHAEVKRGSTVLFRAAKGQNGLPNGTTSHPIMTIGGQPVPTPTGWAGSAYGENTPTQYAQLAQGGQASDCIADVAYSGGNGIMNGRGFVNTAQAYPAGGGGAGGWTEDGGHARVTKSSSTTPSGRTQYSGDGQGLLGTSSVLNTTDQVNGNKYGGGGAGRSTGQGTGTLELGSTGSIAGVRIIWGEHSAGVQRAFPSTGAEDV
jgi:hypothetical protein